MGIRGFDVARYGQAFKDRVVARLLSPEGASSRRNSCMSSVIRRRWVFIGLARASTSSANGCVAHPPGLELFRIQSFLAAPSSARTLVLGSRCQYSVKPPGHCASPPLDWIKQCITAPALKRRCRNTHLYRNFTGRGALGRQPLCNRSVLECLSVSSHVNSIEAPIL